MRLDEAIFDRAIVVFQRSDTFVLVGAGAEGVSTVSQNFQTLLVKSELVKKPQKLCQGLSPDCVCGDSNANRLRRYWPTWTKSTHLLLDSSYQILEPFGCNLHVSLAV